MAGVWHLHIASYGGGNRNGRGATAKGVWKGTAHMWRS